MIWPSESALNLTPSSIAVVSPESTSCGAPEKSKIVSSGVIAVDGEDSAPVPAALVALTVNV